MQLFDDGEWMVESRAIAGMPRSCGAAKLRAHQRQSQLTCKQFVEREARPEFLLWKYICEFDRLMNPAQRLGNDVA